MLGCETKQILLMFYLPYEAMLHSLSEDVIALYGTVYIRTVPIIFLHVYF
jgi:hypothetical protein